MTCLPEPPVSPAAPNGGQCPLCQQANQCAIHAGQPARGCWCMQRPPLGREWLRAHLPAHFSHQQCICRACHVQLEAVKAGQSGA